ncbi:MAG: molecular chaperone TorD family protein [Elusimicrobia bacterium]|nr:molecular chaperone TorD family protein [Elusimicrobiota bacterium]
MTTAAVEKVPAPPRAIALRLVSAGFGYPDAAWRPRFDALLRAARDSRAAPASGLNKLEKALSATPPAELEAQHFRLFGPAPACPLELAFHATHDPYGQAKKIADLAGFYKAFGVESEERADGLPAVLEFLAYLEIKRVHAELNGWSRQRDVVVDASTKLREEIVFKAFGVIARKLHAAGAPEFYLQLSALCRSLLGGAS